MSYNINLGIGRVQNTTAKNIFLRDQSLFEFCRSTVGMKYDSISDYCDEYYSKPKKGKYFGQIVTPINLLGLIQTDENEIVIENELAEKIWKAKNERLASYYMNYFLCMWQYPIPSTKPNSGRDLRIFKPYCLLLKMLLELYKINPREAYFSTYDYSNIFLEPDSDLPRIVEIDENYAKNLIGTRTERKGQGIGQENGSLTYIINTLAESDILTKSNDLFEDDDFYIGLVDSEAARIKAGFIIRAYGDEYFRFNSADPSGVHADITSYSRFINNISKFDQWRSCYMSITRISEFYEYCKNKGFVYSEDLIRRFVLSLETKPFLLLTGISGSGKTKIGELWTKYLAEKNEAKSIEIAVGSNWTDNKKLLGFKNVLLDEVDAYQETELVRFIREANSTSDKQYVVILDEMNLSRVEMYFADFLSALETLDHIITLPNGEDIVWTKNLKIIGTVNVDESTYMFSPKVLDRANVIEMNGQKPGDYIATVEESGDKIYASIKDESWYSWYVEYLEKIYDALGGEFAYRVVDEMSEYLAINTKLYGDDITLVHKFVDEQINQKIMPKLHGSKAQLLPKLDALEQIVDSESYPLVTKKIGEMKNNLKKGYASFIGD